MSETQLRETERIAGVRPRVLRVRDVCRLVCVAKPTLYKMMAAGRFPRPDASYPGMRVALWRVTTVEAWLDRHVGDAT